MHKKFTSIIVAFVLAGTLVACGSAEKEGTTGASSGTAVTTEAGKTDASEETTVESGQATEAEGAEASTASTGADDLFTERDLAQTADTSDAEKITVSDGQDISITKAGTYVISGNASNVTISVDVQDEDKVQLVLDGVSITNETRPCIYVKNADKVFITTTDSENSLSVTGTFEADGDTNTDAVIFAKDDITLNGVGTLNISSSDNAVSCKNDLKVTGGTYNIECSHSAFEAKDSISVADGTINISSCVDGLHAEDDDDNSKGTIYIRGGNISINASDDGIHATVEVTIDGGNFNVIAGEGIESTTIRINDGNIYIEASDDGINAAKKSDNVTPEVEFNGGTTKIVMGAGDTDGVDSNGNITMNGGTVDITGQFTFDFDGQATVNGGTIIENGTETNTITSSMMGGGGGGRGGNPGGGFGH